MCSAHYARYRRSGDPAGKQVLRDTVIAACVVDGCERLRKARGYCGTHYAQLVRDGKISARPRRMRGAGGIDSNGYVVFQRVVDGRKVRIKEHRMVMERLLGRPLLASESVHHRNGDKRDNRSANLELWVTHQPRGQRVEERVADAVEMLRQYAPDLLR